MPAPATPLRPTAPDPERLLRNFAWGRLGFVALLVALAPVLPPELMPERNTSVLTLALLVVALPSSALLVLGRVAHPRRMAWLLSLLDIVVVTAIVTATGGARSIFSFLYVLSVIVASLLLPRTGALLVAAISSVLYTGLVFVRTIVPMTAYFEPPQATTALEVLTIFLNSGTFLIIAIVAGSLADQYRATLRELEVQRKDLSDLQAFKEVIFHSVGTGLIAVDPDQAITAVNRAVEELSGASAPDLVGRPWSVLFGRPIPLDAMEAAMAVSPKLPGRQETTLRRADGALVPVRLTFSALRGGDGHGLGLIAVCEDLSEIRQMEARLRQADRLATLGRMAANIAHEIRNPLGSLTGAIEALTGAETGEEEQQRLAHIVLRESDRLNEIIRNFLDYARPAPLALETVNVAEVLDDVLLLLEHRDRFSQIKIQREFPPSAAWCVDPQQLRQAVWNLCLNAAEAMPDGGALRVGAALGRGRLEVWVGDTGDGIAGADLSHVFEPFFSTKAGGSGLGLSLVHRIVQDHRGEIDVRSTPGQGTLVTMTLPAADG